MNLLLDKAKTTDCKSIYKMQISGFKALLDKYQDFETNPGAETFDYIKERFNDPFTDYYIIKLKNQDVGYIRIVRLNEETCVLSQIVILPEYQNNGYAQLAIRNVETLYPYAKHWVLDTIKQEQKLCCLYEKMGYKQTLNMEHIKDGMDIIYYAK